MLEKPAARGVVALLSDAPQGFLCRGHVRLYSPSDGEDYSQQQALEKHALSFYVKLILMDIKVLIY